MSFFQVLFLSLLQGVTEFLPVSSTGHLFFFQKYLFFSSHSFCYDLFLHIATLFSVLLFFSKKFLSDWKCVFFLKMLGTSCFFTVVCSFFLLPFRDFFLGDFSLSFFFFCNGLILLFGHSALKKNFSSPMNTSKAILIGMAQALSLFPGLSRCGITLCVALLLKVKKKVALFYSLSLSIPTTIMAFFYELIQKNNALFFKQEIFMAFLGFFCTFFIALGSIRILFHFFEMENLNFFAFYSFLISFIIFCHFLFLRT